jgi:predicted exporter
MKLLKVLRCSHLVILVATVLGGASLLLNQPAFETNILSLLPTIHRDQAAETALKIQAENTGSKVAVIVRGPTSRHAEREALRVADEMRSSGLFARVDARVSLQDLKPLADYFQRYPFQLAQQPVGRTDATEIISGARQRIFSPDGMQWLQSAAQDPLLLFPTYLQSILSDGGRFSISNGFIHRDTPTSQNVIIVGHIRGGMYSRSTQQSVVTLLEGLSVPPPSTLLTTGIVLFANESATRTESEVQTISTLTLGAVVAFLLAVFRSPFVVVALTAFTVTSFLGAIFAAHTVLQSWQARSVHLITLGFGSCLLGACVDYAIHFFVAHRLTRPQERRTPIQRVSSGLLLGFITTAIGFIGIAISPFPGLQQLALFCIAGLVLALATVYLILPWLAGSPVYDPHLERCAHWSAALFTPRVTKPSVAIVAGLLLVGLPQLRIIDDIRALNSPSPRLIAQQREVGEVMGALDGGTSVIVEGNSEEEALQREELLRERLERLRGEKRLESYRSLASLVPSQARQRQIYSAYAVAFSRNPEAFANYVKETHLPSQAMNTLQALASSEPAHYALPRECISSGACRTVEDLWHTTPQGTAISTIALEGWRGDPAALVEGIPGARVVNQADAISQALHLYRVSATETALLFYVGVYAIILFRYGWRHSWRVIAPAILGALAALAALGIAGVPVNVFSVFALIVLLGVGVDYAIFFAEDSEIGASTSLAVALSALTTIISFGALSWSSTPALQSFGIVLSVGVLFATLLSPLARPIR